MVITEQLVLKRLTMNRSSHRRGWRSRRMYTTLAFWWALIVRSRETAHYHKV